MSFITAPKLKLSIGTVAQNKTNSESSEYTLTQQQGKKSLFHLSGTNDEVLNSSMPKDNDCCYIMSSPAFCKINCRSNSVSSNSSQLEFIYAGLEIISNSRNIELYLTKVGKTTEEYIQTFRGIKEENDERNGEWFRTIIMIPKSSPTSVTNIRLKLLSLRPTGLVASGAKGKKSAIITRLKFTGRIPNETPVINNDNQTSNIDIPTSSPILDPREKTSLPCSTQQQVIQKDDIQSILHTVLGMSRMMEDSITTKIQVELQKSQLATETCVNTHINELNNEVNDLKQIISMQNSLIAQQQSSIQALHHQQKILIQQQQVMNDRLDSLQYLNSGSDKRTLNKAEYSYYSSVLSLLKFAMVENDIINIK